MYSTHDSSKFITNNQRKPGRSRRSAFLLALGLILSLVIVASADYVGTDLNGVFIKATAPCCTGLAVNDVVSFIITATPLDTGSGPNGVVAYTTVYVPAGVSVIGAEFVNDSGTTIDPTDVPPIADGFGKRKTQFPNTSAPGTTDGFLNALMQDTGIFYITDDQTKASTSLTGVGSLDPSGSPVTVIISQWDYNQVLAFGTKKGGTDALFYDGNDGKGNTPLVDIGAGVLAGTGSGVAGPQTYYTNDYDPDCDAGSGSAAANVEDLKCVGPWNRIQYSNDNMGGSGLITTATEIGLNTDTSDDAGASGVVLSDVNPLPADTNALRDVFGNHTEGTLEHAKITFKITDVTAFLASVVSPVDRTFCASSTGGDIDKTGGGGNGTSSGGSVDRGAQDNIWRYFEGANNTCNITGPTAISLQSFASNGWAANLPLADLIWIIASLIILLLVGGTAVIRHRSNNAIS